MLLLVGFLTWKSGFSIFYITVSEVVLSIFLWLFFLNFKRKIITVLNRAVLHLEAVNLEDFNHHAKPAFPKGKSGEFHQQLVLLSQRLQQQKYRNDQHVFLVYQLIEQLDTPILIFNERQRLTFGNTEFQQLFGQPWQMMRSASPHLLGLEKREKNWLFQDDAKNKKWQIRQSEFLDSYETHQLLMFIDIGSALRESQLNAWQQIIRVLSHEIGNSLTPVSSMAETLLERSDNEKDRLALGMICDRCQHLGDFVNRYSSLSKNFQLNCQWIEVAPLVERVLQLFNDIEIKTRLQVDKIWVDQAFFEQVLINLIKNATEAQADKVSILFTKKASHDLVKIIDNGQGFSNVDNLFVPLYSTKQNGQGIGLNFCRNIIEQHNGIIELTNNEKQGVTVSIQIPFAS